MHYGNRKCKYMVTIQFKLDLSFQHLPKLSHSSLLPSLTEPSVLFFLLLFITRDHVSPLDPC